eukprot:9623201-Alexandrium_andersonii.AAC.1
MPELAPPLLRSTPLWVPTPSWGAVGTGAVPQGRRAEGHLPRPWPPLRGAWPPTYYAELDHLLVPTRWAPAVLDYKSHPQSGLATDHFPVVFTIRVKLASRKEPQQPPKLVFDNSSEARLGYLSALEEALGQSGVSTMPPGLGSYRVLVDSLLAASAKEFATSRKRPRRPWISQDTLDLIECRTKLSSMFDFEAAAE